VTEQTEKIVVTADLAAEMLSLDPAEEREEDVLLPVFFAVATRLFPSDFDFKSNRRVLVVGGPSCGKSTLLKHLAVLCATKQSPKDGEVPFVPLLFSMSTLTHFVEKKEEGLKSTDPLLERYFDNKYDQNFEMLNIHRELLKSKRFWVLIDGIDEAKGSDALGTVMGYLENLCRENPSLRVVMTSRHGVFESRHRKTMTAMGFCVLRMRPLTTSLAEKMLARRLCGREDSKYFRNKEELPEWLCSELRRPQCKLFRKSPFSLMLFVNILLDFDREKVKEEAAAAMEEVHAFREEDILEEDDETQSIAQKGFEYESKSDFVDRRRPNSAAESLRRDPQSNESDEDDMEFKQSCPGKNLVPPYSRIDLFRRGIIKLLNWRPIEEENKTTCSSPASSNFSTRQLEVTRRVFQNFGVGLELEVPNLLKPFDGADPELLEILQVVAYRTHERRSREVILAELERAAERRVDAETASKVLKEFLVRVDHDEAPLFTIEDRDDFVEEETLEQQQHHHRRREVDVSGTPEELKRRGIVMFLHQSLQEHFCAEYIANRLLDVVDHCNGNDKGKAQRWSRGRSLSVHSGSRFLGRNAATESGGKRRRASVNDAAQRSVELDAGVLQELQDEVERLLLGHFDPAQYRISSDWWQPILLNVFDLIYEQAPPVANGREDVFDQILRLLVRSCRRLETHTGRGPACLESFWLAAASYGNVRVAKAMMRIVGVESLLQAVTNEWNNAMHLAAVNNQPEVIKLLMNEPRVDADYLDRNNQHGWDPSNMAMVFNHTYCFRLLCCTDGDKVAETDERKKRPEIVDAAMKGDLSKIRQLLNPNAYSDGDMEEMDLDMLQEEVGAGFSGFHSTDNENAQDFLNRPLRNSKAKPIMNRVHSKRKCVDIARMCSSNKAGFYGRTRKNAKKQIQIDARGSTGMTALMWASRNGHADISRELVKQGANVKLDAQGITSLIFAVESGHKECVQVLLEAGADPMDRTPDDDSSLLCACSFGFDDVAKILIESGASALEALVVSCVQGKDSTVRSLVEGGLVDVNTVWQDLMVTPLAGACVAGHVSTVKLLLALGADPNVCIDVEYGSTPLMLACHMGNLEVVQTMLDAGAEVNIKTPPSSQCAGANGENTTAVSIARSNAHTEVEALLRSRGAKEYVPVDLTFYEWLGGHVRYPLLSADFNQRRRAGTPVATLLEDDPYFHRADLFAWQFLGGQTAGERAWTG